MSISADEFKNGETRNSREEIVYQILGDGKAYSLKELMDEVGIIMPKTKDSLKSILYSLDTITFKTTLDSMIEGGRIVSKMIHGKDGNNCTYYMRKEFTK